MTESEIIALARSVADPDKDDPVRHGLITLTYAEMQRFALAAAAQAPQPAGLEGAKQLAKLNGEIAADLKGEVLQLRSLIGKVHAAKGRHHTQIAMCDLYDAVGLANVRPAKVERKRPDDTEGGAL